MIDEYDYSRLTIAEVEEGVGVDAVLSLEESLDAFSETANRIADQLIEERKRNSRLIAALRRMRMVEQNRPGDLLLIRMIDAALREDEEGQ